MVGQYLTYHACYKESNESGIDPAATGSLQPDQSGIIPDRLGGRRDAAGDVDHPIISGGVP